MAEATGISPEDRLANLFEGSSKWRASRYNLFAPIPGTDLFAGINLFHGSCDTYSKAELYLLSEVEFLKSDHPVMNRLKKKGLIVNFDEAAALESMGRLSPAAPYTVYLTISPTMACNFRCPYCFLDHPSSVMTKKIQDEVIGLAERMLSVSHAKTLNIRWFGGEPLLEMDILEDLSRRLMELASDKGAEYKAWMFTNGYLFTQDIADRLGTCGIDHVTVTLDGLCETHNKNRPLAGGGPTFEKITENLRTLRFPFRIQVRQNLHKGNMGESEALQKLVEEIAEESGNDLQYVSSFIKTQHMKEPGAVRPLEEEDFYDSALKNAAKWFGPSRSLFCDAGNLWSVGINSEGRLFRCWEQQDDPRYSFGYVGDWDPEDPIRTADQPDLFSVFINDSVRTQNEKCRDCVWLPICLGGCPLFRLDGGETCLPWKDKSEDYVLAVYKEKHEKRKME